MTSIQFMSIQGIRAFSPNPRDQMREQQLQFFRPLTVILGANGSGVYTWGGEKGSGVGRSANSTGRSGGSGDDAWWCGKLGW